MTILCGWTQRWSAPREAVIVALSDPRRMYQSLLSTVEPQQLWGYPCYRRWIAQQLLVRPTVDSDPDTRSSPQRLHVAALSALRLHPLHYIHLETRESLSTRPFSLFCLLLIHCSTNIAVEPAQTFLITPFLLQQRPNTMSGLSRVQAPSPLLLRVKTRRPCTACTGAAT